MNYKRTAAWIIGVGSAAAGSLLTSFVGCSVATDWTGYTKEPPGCALTRWPEPRRTGGPDGTLTVFGAARTLGLFSADGGIPSGLDLDELCTCPDRGACIGPQGNDKPCDDGQHGIDNRGSTLFNALFQSPEQQRQLEEGVRLGQHGILVQVSKYNGQPDDEQVTAALYNVVGVNGDTVGTREAKFDGTDRFIVDVDSTLGQDIRASRFQDISAYVSGGTLVASFKSFDLRLLIPGTTPGELPEKIMVPFQSVRLVGALEVTDGGGFRMKSAALAGRIPLSKVFLRVGPASVCDDAGIYYQSVKPIVCEALDLPTDPNDTGKDIACDALSFGLRLELEPAGMDPNAKAGNPTNFRECAETEVRCP